MRTVTFVAALGLIACDPEAQRPSGPSLEIAVAPLSLAGVTDACYDLSVQAGATEVWKKTNLCSSAYGDSQGSLGFVGPCDPSATNTVSLTMRSLDTSAGPADFVNPCPASAPCTRTAVCSANSDTPVRFDLTVMRAANQGFFDIAVTFNDIFCSAKVDCTETLLHDPDTNTRVPTVVMALACTGGTLADTTLYLDGAQLVCGTNVIGLPVSGAAGNVYRAIDTPPAPLVQVANFRGTEALTDTTGASYRKLYANVALALDFTKVTAACTLVATMSAADGLLPFETPSGASYPVIRVDVPLASPGSSAYTCGEHPLGRVPADRVWTAYSTHQTFDERVRLSEQVELAPVALAPSTPPAFAETLVGLDSDSQLVTLSAQGPGHLVVSGASTTGDFVVVDNHCVRPYAVGESCTIEVAFAPSAAGLRSGTLHVTSNGAPQDVALSGTGRAPDPIVVTPPSASLLPGAQQTFSASGGVPPYIYSLVGNNGTLVGQTYTAGNPGTSAVRVTDQLGTTRDATISILDPAPTITSITPNVGSNLGNTLIGIGGTNFRSGVTVNIGGASCAVQSFISTSISCRTSASTNGAKNVVVTNTDGTSATLSGGFTYADPESWVATSTSGAPSARWVHTAVWNGQYMIVAGGTTNGSTPYDDSYRYDPVGNTWSSAGTLPYAAWDMSSVRLNGNAVMVFGGNPGSGSFSTSLGAVYNPTTNSWTQTSTGANVPTPRRGGTLVWTGTVAVVWGGYNNSLGTTNTGGRYNPSNNTWQTTSTSNAPSARNAHLGVWSGSKMLIWGGQGGGNSGGVYDPATDTWSAMSTANGPGAREDAVGVWTGSKFLVWGGYGPYPTVVNTGALYDPTDNTWAPLTALSGSPPQARTGGLGVMIGSKFVVWGGGSNFNSGGVFDTVGSTWAATSLTNVPVGRVQFAGVSTGTKMIVWGGNSGSTINSGGVYTPSP